MLGLFLQPDASAKFAAAQLDPIVKTHALEVVLKGYTIIKGALSPAACQDTIEAFHRFEQTNEPIFTPNRDAHGHYPRIVNLHCAMPDLLPLFARNKTWLAVQDALFGAPAALYTSLFYQVGSQQQLHRDTPVFCTRPEYLYFGNTVYLEPSGEENGCLEVLECGHTIPELDREAMAVRRFGSLDAIPDLDNDIWIEYQDTVVAKGREMGLQVRHLHAEAGDTLIWHPQLPHGGTPIKDPTRTRYSLVMHTTPVGVPVYHQRAFFNPNAPFDTKAPWTYREVEGRQIADFRHGVSFGHERNYTLEEFRLAA
jgi:phytanoyl-CoA hydroxylase